MTASVGTMRQVPFVALDRAHNQVESGLRDAFERVLSENGFILGGDVGEFEAEFASYCQSGDCVGVASGTVALELAMRAAGIGPGDEVIVPAHTFIASALGVVHAGATPIFCDVDAETGLIDADSAASVVSERTVAVIAVHLYGQVCDMDAVSALAERHGLAVIEDAAQAHGARWRGRPAGSFGTAAAFSFYPSKNLGALGDGGAVVTSDPALAERLRQLRNLGQRSKGEHVEIGYNARLDGLQAAFLRAKLPLLDEANAARRTHAAAYDAGLPEGVGRLVVPEDSEPIYHLYPIRVGDRDALAAEFGEHGVATGIHYSPSVPQQPPFAGSERRTSLDRAERWAEEELSLPMFPELEQDEVELVINAVTAAMERRGNIGTGGRNGH